MIENNQNNNNNNQKAQYGVTTDEIMDYLKDNMVTKDELQVSLNKQKLEIIDHIKVITASEAKGIFQMEPFPQLII